MDSDSDASESPGPRAPAVTATIRGSLLRQTCTATLNTALKIRFAAALVQRKGLPGQATLGHLPPPALPPPPGLAWDDADPGPRTRDHWHPKPSIVPSRAGFRPGEQQLASGVVRMARVGRSAEARTRLSGSPAPGSPGLSLVCAGPGALNLEMLLQIVSHMGNCKLICNYLCKFHVTKTVMLTRRLLINFVHFIIMPR